MQIDSFQKIFFMTWAPFPTLSCQSRWDHQSHQNPKISAALCCSAHNTLCKSSRWIWRKQHETCWNLYIVQVVYKRICFLQSTCVDIQGRRFLLQDLNYPSVQEPDIPIRASPCNGGESRPTSGPSVWASVSSADWWGWLLTTSRHSGTFSHTAYDTTCNARN